MTDEPNLTEDQKRVLDALMTAKEAGAPGLSADELAERLEMAEDDVCRHLQALAGFGFAGPKVLGRPAFDPEQPNSPMPPCRRCGKPADGLDHLCTRCRAIWACDRLVYDLTNALEHFLEARWSPLEHDRPHPAHYLTKPDFDGDPEYHLQQITAAHSQLAAAACQLVKLAMPPDLSAKAETPYEPFWREIDEPIEPFDGIHAAIEWGYAEVSSTQPIRCNRFHMGHLKGLVERREVLIPGETPQPHEVAQQGDPGGRPWMQLTPDGVQDLLEYDSDAEGG